MSMDKEAQQDEVVALESIFDKDTFQVHPGDVVSGQIKVRVDLPNPFFVAVETDVEVEVEKVDGNEEILVPGANDEGNDARYMVEYLPPLTLHFTLPNSYPSQTKPNFTLSAVWLHRTALSILCERLDDLWEENKGMGILFTWANYLQANTLTDLSIRDYLDVAWLHQPYHLTKRNPFYVPPKRRRPSSSEKNNLSESVLDEGDDSKAEDNTTSTTTPINGASSSTPVAVDSCNNKEGDGGGGGGNSTSTSKSHKPKKRNCKAKKSKPPVDQRAASDAIPRKEGQEVDLIDYLLSYNEEQIRETYLTSSQTCDICYMIKSGHACVRFLCAHVFCKDCVTQYFTTNITEGNVDLVKCLAFNCKMRPPPEVVKALVGRELFDRYDEILLKRALENMSDITYCPRPKCHNPVLCDPNEKLAVCAVCNYTFCSRCKMVYHGVEPCRFKDADMQAVFKKYTEGTPAEKKALLSTYGKKQLGVLVENVLSEQWIQKESKRCPHCKVPIEKFEGCNKVTCFKCNTYFCWICLKQLEHGNPYFHFNDPNSQCYNNLFQMDGEEEEEDWWLLFPDTDEDDEDWDGNSDTDDDDE